MRDYEVRSDGSDPTGCVPGRGWIPSARVVVIGSVLCITGGVLAGYFGAVASPEFFRGGIIGVAEVPLVMDPPVLVVYLSAAAAMAGGTLIVRDRRLAMIVVLGAVLTAALAWVLGFGRPWVPDGSPPSQSSYHLESAPATVMVLALLLCVCIVMVEVGRHLGPGVSERAALASTWLIVLAVALSVAASNAHAVVFDTRGQVGRPVRQRGRRAAVHARPLGDDTADRWATAAAEEADAVLAFEDLAARLGRVGAPPGLITRCLAAASDERRHTRLACSLAGTAMIPLCEVDRSADSVRRTGRSRRRELRRVAIESLADGVINEGVAARRLRAAGAVEADGRRALVIEVIAADEERHAELGAAIVRWCAGELGGVEGHLIGVLLGTCRRIGTREGAERGQSGGLSGRWRRARRIQMPVTRSRVAPMVATDQ